RIGEFLKELRLAEGRGTGVPKIFRSMHENGSPEPVLDFDDHRTYFRVILPAHPEYVAFWALRDAAYLRATGDTQGALRRLTEALRSRPESALVAAALIREHAMLGDLGAARMAHDRFPREARGYAMVAAAMADAYLDARDQGAARKILDQMPSILSSDEAFDAAILERRAGRQREAHRLFMSAGDRVLADPRAAHEFGQTKMKLANDIPPRTRNRADREARVRLLREAEELLQRVVQMDVPAVRRGWAWYDLGRVRQRLRKPATDVLVAFERAVALCPDEHRFTEALRRAKGLS
ncbi:MAG: hypothetical protein HY718_09205, partial [Planctomycetes bacterium]|nr:hypothetical protein [Planctomycetota bacterium]